MSEKDLKVVDSEKYSAEQWTICSLPYKTNGYWEPLNDGSGRIRVWNPNPDSEDPYDGSWSIDLPPNHPRRIIRAQMSTPFICPVCNNGMYDYQLDSSYYRKYGCCRWCYIDFVEGFEDQWNSGIRPSKEDINKSNQKRPKMK